MVMALNHAGVLRLEVNSRLRGEFMDRHAVFLRFGPAGTENFSLWPNHFGHSLSSLPQYTTGLWLLLSCIMEQNPASVPSPYTSPPLFARQNPQIICGECCLASACWCTDDCPNSYEVNKWNLPLKQHNTHSQLFLHPSHQSLFSQRTDNDDQKLSFCKSAVLAWLLFIAWSFARFQLTRERRAINLQCNCLPLFHSSSAVRSTTSGCQCSRQIITRWYFIRPSLSRCSTIFKD